MPDGMTLLQTFSTEVEANMLLERLRDAELTAVLHTDNVGGMEPQLNLQRGVKIFVADGDLAAARELLATIPATLADRWICPSCTEANDGNFEICWNCGNPAP